MKKFIVAALLATVIASPAFGRTKHPHYPKPEHKNPPHQFTKHQATKHPTAVHPHRST